MSAQEFDVPGLVRRVRRAADLSQAELATMLGVGRATVGRWETGEVSPTVTVFARLLALAGFTLTVAQDDGRQVRPMRPDASTDRAGRRMPAHLDVHLRIGEVGELVGYAPHRSERDARRVRAARQSAGVQGDTRQRDTAHVEGEQARREDLVDPYRAKVREISCLLSAGCDAACACACEPLAA